MKILINASNLKKGGGLQVADSICSYLDRYPQYEFVVVLSRYLQSTAQRIRDFFNVKVSIYDFPKSIHAILTGRDKYLDDVVLREGIDVVLTVFGPSLWIPRVLHVSGFARAQCLFMDSPFYRIMNCWDLMFAYLQRRLWLWSFNRCADVYFTENECVSFRLLRVFPGKHVYTVTNYYNQIYDDPSRWTHDICLPLHAGVTLLTIAANYPHKNLKILIPTICYLHRKYPNFKFRFVLTVTKDEFGFVDEELSDDIVFLGKVPLSECPHLYEQCDIVFSSTLLECFSAVYPEAMRMEKPIITTDLPVIRSLCGDAALYYEALSPESFGEAIYRLAIDGHLRKKLIEQGKLQLATYDTYGMRVQKLLSIVEKENSFNRFNSAEISR